MKCERGIVIDIDLTVTYLAELLGNPRETASRAMKILQKNNLIIYKNKRIIIPELSALATFFKEP